MEPVNYVGGATYLQSISENDVRVHGSDVEMVDYWILESIRTVSQHR